MSIECEGRPFWSAVTAAVSHTVELQTYLAAVRTLSKNNAEALSAGGERPQPLEGKKKETTWSNHYLGSDVSLRKKKFKKCLFQCTLLAALCKAIFKIIQYLEAFWGLLCRTLWCLLPLFFFFFKERSECSESQWIQRIQTRSGRWSSFAGCREAAAAVQPQQSLSSPEWRAGSRASAAPAQPQITLHRHLSEQASCSNTKTLMAKRPETVLSWAANSCSTSD